MRSPSPFRRPGWPALAWLVLLAAFGVGPAAQAELPEDARPEPLRDPDGPVYEVSHFAIQYLEEHPEQPRLADFLPIAIHLARKPTGFAAPQPGVTDDIVSVGGDPEPDPALFHASAIGHISAELLDVFHGLGFAGVYVVPHPADLDIDSERDLRRTGDTVLRLVVSLGRARELRTVAVGERADPSWRIDHPAHARIRDRSPLQPAVAARTGSSDLLRRDVLEEYLFRLNRHPGRRVEAALAASGEGSGVDVDFRVTESKPWFVYAQASNTGTDQTNRWQARYGFVHRQLTNRDDVLTLQYLNQGIDEVHGFDGSYEAPWFGRKRPRWWQTGESDPRWLERDDLPWFGSDRLRWGIHGGWNRLVLEDVAFGDDFEAEEWSVGGRFLYNAWQHRAFFLDLVAGARVRHIDIENESLATRGRDYVVEPEVGFRMERIDPVSTFTGELTYETNLATTSREKAQFFGRLNPDVRWHLLRWDTGVSHYLEPLLFRRAWKDPATARTSTLAHELSLGLRGQYAFDYRLIPQLSQVVGGFFSVRGYRQSAATGDDVYIGSLEYRFHVPQSLPVSREPLRIPGIGDLRVVPQQVYGRTDWDLVVRAFVDAGLTKSNGRPANPISPTTGMTIGPRPEPSETLVGAGLGLELRFRNNFRARADWGRALRDAGSVRKGDDEFYFLFSVLY